MDAQQLKIEVGQELTRNILPFWMNRFADPRGGWYGRMDGKGKIWPDAPKGAVLNARILWTFSSAFRLLGDAAYRRAADEACIQVRARFVDPEYGGVVWSVDADGSPLDTRKQFYAIAFAIYGFSEYYRATGEAEALQTAVELYRVVEAHSFDRNQNGYIEARARDWKPIADMRLSEKDRNEARTMNTHLHILEAYTSLYRVWKDISLSERLRNLLRIFVDRIVRPDGHLVILFDEEWNLRARTVSYGHDIEASWLLPEAAETLGDPALCREVQAVSERIAAAAMEGFTPEGGMINERDPETGRLDANRDWWVQAETVLGCLNQFRTTGVTKWQDAAFREWQFVKSRLRHPDGEWYWAVNEDDSLDTEHDLAGFWKCPYHNGRMCMEILKVIGKAGT